MEIQIYDLKTKNEEFKDLTHDQLMKIADLCMDYYKLGQYSVQEDIESDKQDEIDELEQKLEDSDYEYDRLARKYEDLEEAFNNIKDERNELKQKISELENKI